jgi:hypothetical protein
MNDFAELLARQFRADPSLLPQRIRVRHSGAGRVARLGTIAELRAAARRQVPRVIFDFMDGAADDELPAMRNEAELRVRRGADIVKALALWARACLAGRAIAYGLGVAGHADARRAVEILRDELRTALALAGCPSVHRLNSAWVGAGESSGEGRRRSRSW